MSNDKKKDVLDKTAIESSPMHVFTRINKEVVASSPDLAVAQLRLAEIQNREGPFLAFYEWPADQPLPGEFDREPR